MDRSQKKDIPTFQNRYHIIFVLRRVHNYKDYDYRKYSPGGPVSCMAILYSITGCIDTIVCQGEWKSNEYGGSIINMTRSVAEKYMVWVE